jgi:hypothetical protein
MTRRAKTFTEFVHARVLRTDPTPFSIDKMQVREIAERCGVRVPRLLAVFDTVADVDLQGLPGSFALKPTNMDSGRGVFILDRDPKGAGFWDRLRREHLSEYDIKRRLHALAAEHACNNSYLAEEVVVGENGPGQLPYDYRLFTFGDQVRLVTQVNRNTSPTSAAYMGPNFEPLDLKRTLIINQGPAVFVKGVRPANFEEMLHTARVLAGHLRTSFIRVDLYTTGREVILGELTPTPGRLYNGSRYTLTPEFNLELGQAWAEASTRLGVPIPANSSALREMLCAAGAWRGGSCVSAEWQAVACAACEDGPKLVGILHSRGSWSSAGRRNLIAALRP